MSDEELACKTCKYWSLDQSVPGLYSSGFCHFWPPVQSNEFNVLITEHPAISELRNRLSKAEGLQEELIAESERLFKNYPVKVSYEELEEARNKVVLGKSYIDELNSQLIAKEDDPSCRIEDGLVTFKRGVWPITAGDDWCGQWNSES